MKFASLVILLIISIPSFSQMITGPVGSNSFIIGSLYDSSVSIKHQAKEKVLEQNQELKRVKDHLVEELASLWNKHASQEEIEMLMETIEICEDMIYTNREILMDRVSIMKEVRVNGK